MTEQLNVDELGVIVMAMRSFVPGICCFHCAYESECIDQTTLERNGVGCSRITKKVERMLYETCEEMKQNERN